MQTYKPLFLIAVLFLFSVNTTLASDCGDSRTPSAALKRAAAVFSGKVVAQERQRITDTSDSGYGGEALTLKLKVDRWWKGSGNSEVVLRTSTVHFGYATRRSSDDFKFILGGSYLVYADYFKGWLMANCVSRTRTLDKAAEDLKELGAGFPPEKVNYQKQNLNLGQLPVADYNAMLPTDPKERLLREKRNRLRNIPTDQNGTRIDPKKFMITEQRNSTFGGFPTHSPPEPAIPAASSAAIVIGEVTNTQAFLSEDKVSIHSEFDVKINEILKNESSEPLKIGSKIMISRGGGAVRLPSGRIIQYFSGGKLMPNIGGKYVFFLKHNAETEEYPLVTAYEILEGEIIPLDGIDINWTPVYELASHLTYKGLPESEFISHVRKAIREKRDVFELKR